MLAVRAARANAHLLFQEVGGQLDDAGLVQPATRSQVVQLAKVGQLLGAVVLQLPRTNLGKQPGVDGNADLAIGFLPGPDAVIADVRPPSEDAKLWITAPRNERPRLGPRD